MNKRGQITLETVVLIIVVVAAFLAMHGYLRRAAQGQWRTNADSFSDEQYDAERSRESADASKLSFIGSNIKAEAKIEETESEHRPFSGNYPVADRDMPQAERGIIAIEGWGYTSTPNRR